jgi:uncharacterized protein YjbI with pentapeptide repeats
MKPVFSLRDDSGKIDVGKATVVGGVAAALIAALFSLIALAIGTWTASRSEEQRTQESELQTYLDDVGGLLLDEGAAMLAGDSSNTENALVRAKTVGLVRGLDAPRKTTVVSFLYDTSMIRLNSEDLAEAYGDTEAGVQCPWAVSGYAASGDAESPVLLYRAHLEGVALPNSYLRAINLSQTYLSGANFYYSDLHLANLYYSKLDGALLQSADFSCANLRGTDLSNADLRYSDLRYSDLSCADLDCTDLSYSDLSCAELQGASLQGATGLAQEQLEQAIGDEGTVLPEPERLQRPEAWGMTPDDQKRARCAEDPANTISETFGLPQMLVLLGAFVLLAMLAAWVFWRVRRTGWD